MRRSPLVSVLSLSFVLSGSLGSATSATVLIEADRDATLIEDPDGALANGSGPNLFIGRTSQSQNGIRRSLVRFDVAAALPQEALVDEVELRLQMVPSNPEPREIRLHRVLADWSEGPSSSSGGLGRPSEPGDVTWLHTFYDTEFWVHAGGQFVGRESAGLLVEGPGAWIWESTPHLVQDVRLWLRAPGENHGWMLIGDETASQTAKSFGSRENPDPSLRPVLALTYHLPAER